MTHEPEAIAERLYHYARANLVAGNVPFDQETPLEEAGLDSFCIVELLLFSERSFGVSVPESHLTQANLTSLASLARCIAGLAPNGAASRQAPG